MSRTRWIRIRASFAIVLGAFAFPSTVGAQTSALFLDSQPTDFIGKGRTYTYTSPSTEVSVVKFYDGTLRFLFTAPDGSYFWDVEFGDRQTGRLVPGLYVNAYGVGSYFIGMSVSGSPSVHDGGAGCNTLRGRFLVREVEYAADGTVLRFAADFEQHCDDNPDALYGAMRYNSTLSGLVPFDGDYPVNRLTIEAPLHGRVQGGGIDCGSAHMQCQQTEERATTVQLVAIPEPGFLLLGWSGDCTGGGPVIDVKLQGKKDCSAQFGPAAPSVPRRHFVYAVSQLPALPDEHRYLDSTTAWWVSTRPSFFRRNRVDVQIDTGDDKHYYVTVHSASGTVLQPGTYKVGDYWTDFYAGNPFIEVGCNAASGEFVISDLVSSGESVQRFALDFDVACSSSGNPRVYGSIRFDSLSPLHSRLTSVAISSDKTPPQGLGVPITFTAAADGGGDVSPTEFKWWVFDGTAWKVQTNWTSLPTFTWTPAAAYPNASIGVWARTGGSTREVPETTASVRFPIQPKVLLSSSAGSVIVGGTVSFTATGSDGFAPYSYKWWIFDGVTWHLGRDWATDSTFNWTPDTTGNEDRVSVWIRSADDTSDRPEASASVPIVVVRFLVIRVTLTADSSAPGVPGSTITFNASTSTGTQPIQYKWWTYSPQAGWTVARDWAPNAVFAWTPTVENAGYSIGVWARSAGAAVDERPDSVASLAFPILRPGLSSVAISADHPSPQPPGTSVTFTATPVGATSVQFKWFLYNGTSWQRMTDWNPSRTFTLFTLAANPNYRVGAWVRTAGSFVDAPEVAASVAFPIVVPRVETLSLSVNPPSPVPPGTIATFTATATGGTAPYEYKWFVYDGFAWTVIADWSTANSLPWTAAPGNPISRVGVWVRSAGSFADAPEAVQSVAYVFSQ